MAKAPEPKPDRIVEQSTRVAKTKRKLHATAQLALDDQVKKLVDDPLLGAPKTGALAGVRVVTFKADRQQWLLAYEFNVRRNAIELLDLGSHEHFYRDLQNYRADRS